MANSKMSRGFVKKRNDTWYAYWRDPAGMQRAKAVGPRKKEAEAYVAKMQQEVSGGIYREIKAISFPEFAELWLRDYAGVQVKPSTLLNYRSMLGSSLIPYIGSISLPAIETAKIQRYVAERLASGASPSTVHKALVLLKSMLGHAVEWGYLKVNPATPVKAPRKQFIEMQALSPAEVQAFLNALDDKWYPLFFTAIFTGMRLGELLAMQWTDINWLNSTIRVRRSVWHGQFQEPKTKNSIRTIGMSPRLVDVLKNHLASAPVSEMGIVFCSESGALLDDANLRDRVFEPTLIKAGLRKIRIHDLRHAYASLLINQGENLKYVQNQLGHASITTTVDRYGHLMPDAHNGVGQRLDNTVFSELDSIAFEKTS